MSDLIQQEKFELEVLDQLQSAQLLVPLLFVGGTMLRLCHGLNRFSVDLDFWFLRRADYPRYFRKCREALSLRYNLRDSANKFHTILFEITSPDYPRGLKLEMRKGKKKIESEEAIASSPYSHRQVLVKTLSLESYRDEKINALIERQEVRDAFDLEFILRKGIEINADEKTLKKLAAAISAFKPRDYQVKLGSLLEAGEREYYRKNRFKFLLAHIQGKLNLVEPG